MAAANTDKWRKKRSNFSTTLSGGINDTDTSLTPTSVTGLATDTGIMLTIDRVDADGNPTPSLMERVIGVISGGDVVSLLRGQDNTTAKDHSNGAVIEELWEGDTWNDAVDSFLNEHAQDGSHDNTVLALLAGAQTFTGAKTFGSGLLIATNIVVGGNTLTLPSATDTVAVLAAVQTLTNKRITKRVGTTASSATPTPSADSHDVYTITALGEAAELQNPTGTPTNGQTLIVRIKDDGTGRALTYDTQYRAVGVTLPTTTVASKTIYIGMIWNSADSKWDVIAVAEEA